MLTHFLIWNPNPIIFTIPFAQWPVRWYGVSWALAFFASSIVFSKIFKDEKRPQAQLDSLTFYILIATVVGARLGHCMFYDTERYLAHPLDILKVYEGGLASHGAAIGIITGMWLYCRKYKENLLWLFDRMVVVVPLASAFIRFGNFMNSEIVGKITDVPWAVIFVQVDQSPRHPAQLYEAIFSLFLFGIIYFLCSKKRQKMGPGFAFGLYCTLMFSFRFLVEFLKENQSPFENEMFLNMGQLLSIPFVVLGMIMIKRSFRKPVGKKSSR
jgi:phosphatidylglycerol:prolipoprotein diacylglycerol transferase